MEFLGGAAEPATGPSLDEQPMRGMHQDVIDKLSLCKENTEACILEEARQGAVKSC